MTTVFSHIARRMLLCTTAVALASTFSGPAIAADMLEQEAMPQTVVEFGTGWYIRGEISLNDGGTLFEENRADNVAGTQDQLISTSDATGVFGATLAVGQRLTNNLRVDASYAFLGEGEFSETGPDQVGRPPCINAFELTNAGVQNKATPIENCISSSGSTHSLQHFGINGFWDFDTNFYGFRPFVGAGIGVIRNRYTSFVGDTTCTPTNEQRCSPTDGGQLQGGQTGNFGHDPYTQQGSRNDGVGYHMAGSLTAGVSMPINKYMSFDTSYQYTKMTEDAMWGSSASASAKTPTDFHAIKLGLRFDIF